MNMIPFDCCKSLNGSSPLFTLASSSGVQLGLPYIRYLTCQIAVDPRILYAHHLASRDQTSVTPLPQISILDLEETCRVMTAVCHHGQESASVSSLRLGRGLDKIHQATR